LQELHELELHDEHPEDVGFSMPDMPKTESFFLTFSDLQKGHAAF